MSDPAPIVYVEIPAPDLDRASAFYASVFGWAITPSDLSGTPYAMFSTGEGGLAGGLSSERPVRTDGGVILYLKVDDISEAIKAVEAHGGTSVRSKEEIGGDYGFSAEVRDPNGSPIGLWCER